MRVESKDMLGQKTRHRILIKGSTWTCLGHPDALLLPGDCFT